MIKYIKPFIAPLTILIIYKLIDYLARKIKLNDYSFEGKNETGSTVKISWFNASSINQYGNTNVYYRFKVNKVLVFINRNEITFIDKLRLILWFFNELRLIKLNKFYRPEDRKLPIFIVQNYVFPKETEIIKNLETINNKC